MKIEIIDGFMPERSHEDDAGLDIRAAEDVFLRANSVELIRAGFKIQLDKGHEAQIRSRSGLAINNKVMVLNSPGTVDTGYRGEIKVILANFGSGFEIKRGDRIAQMVISKFETPEITEGKVLEKTSRGDKGFGSTGVKDKESNS